MQALQARHSYLLVEVGVVLTAFTAYLLIEQAFDSGTIRKSMGISGAFIIFCYFVFVNFVISIFPLIIEYRLTLKE